MRPCSDALAVGTPVPGTYIYSNYDDSLFSFIIYSKAIIGSSVLTCSMANVFYWICSFLELIFSSGSIYDSNSSPLMTLADS